jgi:hypothetical protein
MVPLRPFFKEMKSSVDAGTTVTATATATTISSLPRKSKRTRQKHKRIKKKDFLPSKQAAKLL